ncbi:MAG TPA: 50S ribosomal protein L6 [Opitutales bacterium]|jgi:large subunit ribosomal protein L6|nr:50S ribosomal protein L6 [Opitutales bacterium]
MSRIGKLPVVIPDKVKVSVKGNSVLVEGPKGKVEKTFDPTVTITADAKSVVVKPRTDSRAAQANHGTARAVINNMVFGVVNGYTKDLEIQGVGFKAALKGTVLDLALGYSHPIAYAIPTGIKVTVAENAQKNPIIKVEGPDKTLVGQVAADIRHFYPVEPYKGKGVRITGQHVRRKEGKKTA